jgi:hypothetical protein
MSELLSQNGDMPPSGPSTAPITVKSLAPLPGKGNSKSAHVSLPPSAPSEYLKQVTAMTLVSEGFGGAEAGALSEVERLLEHRMSIPAIVASDIPIVARMARVI